jgi:hypothetical protein
MITGDFGESDLIAEARKNGRRGNYFAMIVFHEIPWLKNLLLSFFKAHYCFLCVLCFLLLNKWFIFITVKGAEKGGEPFGSSRL